MKTYLPRVILVAAPFLIQSFILFFYLLPSEISVYGSNDDALIASFSVDSDLGINRDNWIFVKSLVSIPATYLQNYLTGIGIYGLLLGLTIIIATSAVYSLISYLPSLFLKLSFLIIYTSIVIVFTGPALVSPTYTGAAIFAGASGFGLLFFNLIARKSESLDTAIIGTLLISLSYLIRTESFLLALGFFLALYIYHLIFYKKAKFSFSNFVLPSLIFLLVFLTNFALDQINYKDSDWKKYIAINDLRHSIQLRSAEYYIAENLSEVSWTESEFSMFRKFSMYDENKLNVEFLSEIVDASSSTRGLTAILNSKPINELIFINYSYGSLHWVIAIMIFFIFALIATTATRSIDLALYLIPILASSLAVNYVFAVSYHLPQRLTFNFLFLVVTSIFVVAVFQSERLKNFIGLNKLASIFLTLMLVVSSYLIYPRELNAIIETNQSNSSLYKSQQKSIQQLRELNPNVVLAGTGSRIVYHYQNPYKIYRNIDSQNQIIISGWHNLSPSSKDKISSLGFSREGFQNSILSDPNIFWVDDPNAKDLLQRYFESQTTADVLVEDLGYLGDPFYRVFSISEAN